MCCSIHPFITVNAESRVDADCRISVCNLLVRAMSELQMHRLSIRVERPARVAVHIVDAERVRVTTVSEDRVVASELMLSELLTLMTLT
jgi:hypothetical protein